MALGPKLDGAGTVKIVTLEESLGKLQSVHALVERMAAEAKGQKPLGPMEIQLKRLLVPMQGQLKMQFQLIGDLVTAMVLVAGRGGGSQAKVRAYREFVAQLRTQLEIAIVQTKEKHEVKDDPKDPSEKRPTSAQKQSAE
ncbi:MAG TPA: hypothetical protein VE967_09820 [Gemmatimonadaceae bacterium]|nr:hypothetical protein [Gemmatimonadaceae bacterium]